MIIINKSTRGLLCWALLLTLQDITLAFQDEVGDGRFEDRAPNYNAEQRLELARKLIEPVRQEALADATSKARLYFLTKHMAPIDPVWTANFILEHQTPNDMLYDYEAVYYLAGHPDRLPDDLLVRLLEHQHDSYFPKYCLLAIRALSAGKADLQRRILELAKRPCKLDPGSIISFVDLTELANRSGDQPFIEQAKQQIEEYFTSGLMKSLLDEQKKPTPGESDANTQIFRSMLYRFAPEEYRAELADVSQPPLWMVFYDETRTDEDRLSELRGMGDLRFPRDSFYLMATAGNLGFVAPLDCGLALKWADEAPRPIAKIWAKLNIAPALARKDPVAGKKLIQECYEQLGKVDGSDRNNESYNFPPARRRGRAPARKGGRPQSFARLHHSNGGIGPTAQKLGV